MIRLFTHYVPGRLIVLASLEAVVLLMAAYVGISLDLARSGATISGAAEAVPSQAWGCTSQTCGATPGPSGRA